MREKKREINRGKEREVDGWRQGKKKRKRRTSLGQKFSFLWVVPEVPYLEVKEQEIRMTSDTIRVKDC